MIKLFLLSFLVCVSFAQYNPELSKDLCQLTVASYCRPTKLIDWSCGPCKNSVLQIQNVSLFINSTMATLGYISVSKKLDAISNNYFDKSARIQRYLTMAHKELDLRY